MANKELKIPIHYRKYAAMREALERGGKNFDEQLQAKAEEWYQELIPEQQRKEIQKQIEFDDAAESMKAKQFAVVRIRDEFEAYAFTTEHGADFYSIAKDYAEADKDEALKQYTVDTIGQRCFNAEGSLDDSVYEVLCDSIKTNPLITAVVDFDLYEGIIGGFIEEKELLKITNKIEDYQVLLRDLYWIVKIYTREPFTCWSRAMKIGKPTTYTP